MRSIPPGIRNNNPGNIRSGQRFLGEVGVDSYGFAVFDKPENGIRAIAVDLLTKMERAVDTVREIITRWAPPKENNTEAYIRAVCVALGVKDDDILSLNHADLLCRFVRAIIVHENGWCPYPDSMIEDGVQDVLVSVFGGQAEKVDA